MATSDEIAAISERFYDASMLLSQKGLDASGLEAADHAWTQFRDINWTTQDEDTREALGVADWVASSYAWLAYAQSAKKTAVGTTPGTINPPGGGTTPPVKKPPGVAESPPASGDNTGLYLLGAAAVGAFFLLRR